MYVQYTNDYEKGKSIYQESFLVFSNCHSYIIQTINNFIEVPNLQHDTSDTLMKEI